MTDQSAKNPPTANNSRPNMRWAAPSKRVKQALKILALLIGCFVLTTGGLLTAAFLKPSLLINERTLAYTKKVAAKFDAALVWDQLQFSADKPSLWVHHFAWDISRLCITAPSLPLHFCADRFAGQFNLVWNIPEFPRIVHVEDLKTWQLTGGKLTVGPFHSSEKDDASSFDINHMQLPWILERTTIEPSRFTFDQLRLQLSDVTFEGPLELLIATSDVTDSPSEPFKRRLTLTVQDVDKDRSSVCWTDLTAAKTTTSRQCLDRFLVSAALGTRDGLIRVAQIGPVSLHARDTHLRFSTGDAAKATPPESTSDESAQIPALLADASLAKIDVTIQKSSLRMMIADEPWSITGNLDVSVANTSQQTLSTFEDLNLQVSTGNICTISPYVEGCFQKIDLGARIGRKTRASQGALISIQKALVASRNLTVLIPEENAATKKTQPTAPPPTTKKSKPKIEEQPFDWQGIPFEHQDSRHYSIKIDQFRVIPIVRAKRQKQLASGRLSAALNAPRGNKTSKNSEWSIRTAIKPSGSVRLVTGDIRLGTNGEPLRLPTSMVLQAKAALATGEKVHLALSGRRDVAANKIDTRVILDGRVHAENIKGVVSPGISIRGFIDPQATQLTLDGKIALSPKIARVVLPNITTEVICNQDPPPGPNLDLTAVGLNACSVDLKYADGFDHGQFAFRCPVHLDARLTSPEAEAHQESRSLSVDFTTDAHVEGVENSRFTEALAWQGQANILLTDHNFAFREDWLDLKTQLHGSFLTSQKNPAQDATWKTNGSMDLEIKKFASLVKILERLPYAIISPFNVLDGRTAFSMKFDGNSQSKRIDIPFSIKTELQSPAQKLYARGDGLFQINHLGDKNAPLQTNTNFKLALDDIGLTLPNISINEKFPMLFPDSRIEVGTCADTKKPDEPSTASFDISVASNAAKPIRIRTNLTKEEIPILINGHFSDKTGLAGNLNVNEFGFEVFRRKADVKSFNVKIDPAEESLVVDGNLEFKYTDITINLLIRGTADEPIVTFESNPIRSEREIIAMLLYGQDASSIDDDQMQTADDLSAAFADQMIGLASLFVLAKTPVESVHYNPATKVFNAKVRLDTDTSLNLGTTSDAERRVGVRHRLSSTWSVQTDVAKDDQRDTTSGSAILEWSKRF